MLQIDTIVCLFVLTQMNGDSLQGEREYKPASRKRPVELIP